MVQATREELRIIAGETSSDELARLANILVRNLEELERMNSDHKAQTQEGFERLDNNIRELGHEVKTGFGKIFNQDDGLAGKVTVINAELKHKPGYRGLYGALVAQLTLFLAIVVAMARIANLI